MLSSSILIRGQNLSGNKNTHNEPEANFDLNEFFKYFIRKMTASEDKYNFRYPKIHVKLALP